MAWDAFFFPHLYSDLAISYFYHAIECKALALGVLKDCAHLQSGLLMLSGLIYSVVDDPWDFRIVTLDFCDEFLVVRMRWMHEQSLLNFFSLLIFSSKLSD